MEEKSKYFHNFSDIFFPFLLFPLHTPTRKNKVTLNWGGRKRDHSYTFSSQILDIMINTSKPKAVTVLSKNGIPNTIH